MIPAAEQTVTRIATTSSGGDLTGLRRLLGGADVEWLVLRVRGQIATGHTSPLSGTVQLRKPTDAQRAGALRLVGPPRRTSEILRVDLGALEDLLGRGTWTHGLADAVLALTGPVATWPRENDVVDAAWVRAAAGLTPALLAFPALETWWRTWCADGRLKRAAGSDPVAARRLAADAAACLCALPTCREPLAVFARRITGDAHALDRTRPLSNLLLEAVRALAPGATGISSRRETWASVGLLPSTVSATVLGLGIPGDTFARNRGVVEASATATALDAGRAARMPVVLTLDQVRSGGVGVVPAGGVVHVCTSPSIVGAVAAEASRRVGPGTTPSPADTNPILVCTDGPPGAAVFELLERLSGAGAEVRFHGDFDWEGLRAGSALAERVAWTPWRFSAMDYAQAVAALVVGELAEATTDREQLTLRGATATSPWDPALATTMAARGAVIEEDDVAGWLVADLLDASGFDDVPLDQDPLD
ncbi:TIGR02679 family protein [Pengzhenrongella phosphoraccumulans]|uniref:TIGR02679 family protein n=1 Tax=Pengzhenrongella phosphoraccumulans TaxID=3114394 RepID=UPI00388DA27B